MAMDDANRRRWLDGQRPFDGVVLVSPELRSEEIRSCLVRIVPVLEASVTTQELRSFFDWHQHDGYVAPTEGASWDSLNEAVASPQSFIAASSDDTFVRRAWYPGDFSFLLRWCVSSDPDDFGLPPGEPAGDFDLTGSSQLVDQMSDLVPGARVEAAKPYFDRIFVG